jgi:hypothetical protein
MSVPRRTGSPRALARGLALASLALLVAPAARAQGAPDSPQAPRVGDRVRLTSAELWKVPRSPLVYMTLAPYFHRPRERRVGGTVRALGDSVTVRTFGSVLAYAVPTTTTVSSRSVTRWEVSRGRRRAAGAAFGVLYGVVGGTLTWGMCGIGGGPGARCSAAAYVVAPALVGAAVGAIRAPDRWRRVPPPATDSTR